MSVRAPTVCALVLVVLGACKNESSKPDPAHPSDTASTATGVEIIELEPSAEPLEAIVLREQARAAEEGRDLLIYVGATWCEPCQRFHEAVKRGELDRAFPKLRLLELDADRDRTRLMSASCTSKLIPMFARPDKRGGCDPTRAFTGSIKGPGAVANITPRLRSLLAR